MLTLSAAGIIAGLGLLKFRPWAWILAIGLSVLGLLNVPFGPFGTVLAIYGLWVLLARATERLSTTTTPTAAP